MKALVLRLDAPMMSFGSVLVDQHGFVDHFPGQAMLTGLCANALGWEHGDFDKLQKLQQRLDYAARWDVLPQPMVDYHTVDLGQPKMIGYADRTRRGDPPGGWTTRGLVEHRAGSIPVKFGIHQRYRHYWVNGLMTVVLGLKGDQEPQIETLAEAFQRPARPLFLGRKTCLPARPLLDPQTPIIEGENLLAILQQVAVWDRAGQVKSLDEPLPACWPADSESPDGNVRRVFDLRDWANQIHAGSRRRVEGVIGEDS